MEWTDYLQAQYLHMRANRWTQILGYVFIAFMVVSAVVVALSVGDQNRIISYLWPFMVIAGLSVLYFYAVLPRRVRRLFEQQKELSSPFELEITPTSLITTSTFGHSNRPWTMFRKWKENDHIFLLYLSDVLFTMIPKRFCTPEQVEAIRARLQENKLQDANRSYRSLITLAIYFAILIVTAAAMYIYFRNAAP